MLLRNRDRLPLLWPPVFDHLASIIRGKGVSFCADAADRRAQQAWGLPQLHLR